MPIYRSVGRSGPPFLGKATKSTSYRIRTTFVLSSCTHHAGESQTCASDNVRRLCPQRGRASPSRKPSSGFWGGISRQLFFQGLLHPFLPVAVSLGCQQQYRRDGGGRVETSCCYVRQRRKRTKNCQLRTCHYGRYPLYYNVLSTVTSHHAFNWGGARWSLFAFVPPHRAPIVSLPPDCPFLSERTYSTDVLHRRAKNG